MQNIPKDLIAFLDNNFVINSIKIDRLQKSKDGTIKNAIELFDGILLNVYLFLPKIELLPVSRHRLVVV